MIERSLCRCGLSVVLVVALSACEDDSGASAPAGGGSNAGGNSAGNGSGTNADAGADGGADAGQSDAGASELDCNLGGGLLELPFASPSTQGFAAAVSGIDLLITYLVPSCGGTPDSTNNYGLRTLSVPSGGPTPEPEDVINTGDDACFVTRDPALAWGPNATQKLAYYVSNQAGGYQVFAKDLDAEGLPQKLSDESGRVSTALSAHDLGDGSLVAWASEAPAEKLSQLLVYSGTSAASRRVFFDTQLAHRVLALRVGSVSGAKSGERVGLVGWVSSAADTQGIYMQRIGADGTAQGDLIKLTDRIGGSSSVDFAAHMTGGAVVYTEGAGGRHVVRFQALDAKGAPTGSAARLTTAAIHARDASITRFAAGYAIAYRVVEGTGDGKPVIRLAFVDAQGNQAGTRDVAFATDAGGQVRVLQSLDGRLFLVWQDYVSGAPVLRVARATCLP